MSSRICPLCQHENKCTPNQSCWCMTKTVPAELIKQARDIGISEQCICQSCVDAYKLKHENINSDAE